MMLFRVRGLSTCVALVVLAAALSPDLRAREWEQLVEQGDRWAKKARQDYDRASEAWTQVERAALKAGDTWCLERARKRRARLLLTLGDYPALQSASGRVDVSELDPLEPAFDAGDAQADLAQLEESLAGAVSFFTRAGRAYFRSPEAEKRDLTLLFESLALLLRLSGDVPQARADAQYQAALAALSAAELRGPATEAAIVRVLYKLREFDRARETLAAARIDDSALPREDRIAYLRTVRDLAALERDETRLLALNRQLVSLGDKAGDQPPPALGFSSFLRGRPAALIKIAATLHRLASVGRLEARDRALLAYLGGMATLEAGQPALAAGMLERVRQEDCGENWLRAQVAARLGEALESTGDYEAALSSYRKVAGLLSGLSGVERFVARVRLNTAAALLRLGDLLAARTEAEEVIRAARMAPEIAVAARVLLGDTYYLQPDKGVIVASEAQGAHDARQELDDALAAYRLAREELDALERADRETLAELGAQIEIHTGNCYRRMALAARSDAEARARRQEAIRHAEQAFERANTHGLARLAAVAAANLGELYLESGDPASARRFAGWALTEARKIRYFETEWRAHWYLGRIAASEGDDATSLVEFSRAADIVEKFRSRILDSRLKASFMSTKQTFFESFVARHLETGDTRAAFEVAERARSRALVETLGLRFLLFAADRERTLYRQYIDLVGRAERARRGNVQLFAVSDPGAESYEQLRVRVDELRERIRSHPGVSPAVKSLVAGEASDLPTVQGGLEDEEVLLEYFSTGKRLVLFVVTRSGFRAVELDVSPLAVSRLVSKFLDSAAADATHAGELYRLLVAPVEAIIRQLGSGSRPTRVTIVPWGPLHRVPFEALRSEQGYLVERWEMTYLPSATTAKYLPRDSAEEEAPRRLVALVDPDTDYDRDGQPDYPRLPFAKQEVEGITPLFEKNDVFVGSEAREDLCADVTPRGDVVHLACHGEFFPSRPLESTLYLSRGGEGSDGRLRAVEIFGLDLKNSRLVTLSGCETGRMELAPGDDPVGIGSAFLHSGARALLVSLWKVEDEATAALMTEFYRNWLDGDRERRAEALRETKLKMIREGRFAHPRQWAAFVLVGMR